MKLLISLTLVLLGLLLIALLLGGGALVLNRLPWSDAPGPMARLAIYLSNNVAELRDDAVLPELRPRRYPVAPEALFAALERAVATLGWQVTDRQPASGELTAVVTTPLLRFKDDVEMAVEPADEGGSLLQARAASRLGKADFGTNTRHLLDLRAALEAELAAVP